MTHPRLSGRGNMSISDADLGPRANRGNPAEEIAKGGTELTFEEP
jgi:hypothetical protein